MNTKLGRCECREHEGINDSRCPHGAVILVELLRDPAKAERILADVRGFLRYDDYKQVALCAACADFHESKGA